MQIEYSHPDEGLFKTLKELQKVGIKTESRNGPVLRFPEPVILKNTAPLNRVSMWEARNANPYFHFMEALWMLAGMNEIKPMEYYNSGMAQYSDDGQTLRGTAYGYKWRRHFGYDQLELAIERLQSNPDDRRIVMTMWDPREEWRNPDSKDLSCNLQVIFGTRLVGRDRFLDMEVTNRSNDIIYGCLGSNVFHFTFLQEYVAYRCGFRIGDYYQVAFNLHAYVDNPVYQKVMGEVSQSTDFATPGEVITSYMSICGFDATPDEIAHFVRTGDPGRDTYLAGVGVPLYESYRAFKLKSMGIDIKAEARIPFAQQIMLHCQDGALNVAGRAWLERKLSHGSKKKAV